MAAVRVAVLLGSCLRPALGQGAFLEKLRTSLSAMPDVLRLSVAREGSSVPWPLPDPNNLMVSTSHALHCRQMVHDMGGRAVQGFDKVHLDHCAAQLAPVEALINETGLVVPAGVCRALFPQTREPDVEAVSVYDLWNTSDAERARRGELVEDPETFLLQLAGFNFGRLIRRGHEGTLTPAEREYMDSWQSPPVTGQAAVALACDSATTTAWMRGQAKVLAIYVHGR